MGLVVRLDGGRRHRRLGVIGSAAGEDALAAYRFRVQGRVQGVGYRYYVLREAEQRQVTGYVRNLPDGSVEVVAEGSDAGLSSLEERLREGPAFSHVDSVEREVIKSRGDLGFHIR
jgi:acylphosphatase